ncbi:Uncharacterised protein [uncultured archaeon]|nr:Uncharacterised protein [uncultured archaeon]
MGELISPLKLSIAKFQSRRSAERPVVIAKRSDGGLLLSTPLGEQLLNENPGIVKFFLNARTTKAAAANFGDFQIERMDGSSDHHRGLWKLTIHQQHFFVKESISSLSFNAALQFNALLAVDSMGHPQVAAIRPYLAFSTRRTSFVVVDYADIPSSWSGQMPYIARWALDYVYSQVKNIFNISDIGLAANYYYDSKSSRAVVLDPCVSASLFPDAPYDGVEGVWKITKEFENRGAFRIVESGAPQPAQSRLSA